MKVRQVLALVFLAFLQAEGATGQSFSCPIGREPACLDYGDRVVDQSAACFDTYQCNYEGFTCKSHLSECSAEYDRIQSEYNDLVDKHNTLIRDFNTLQEASQSMESDLREIKDCIRSADSIEDAQACRY